MEQLLERLEAEKAKHRAVLDEGMSRTVSTFALIVFLAICNAAKYAAM